MQTKTTKVLFSTAAYERSHGRAPRGYGRCAFCPAEHAGKPDYLKHTFFVAGNIMYSHAKAYMAITRLLPADFSGVLEVMP
jgi:hypothetical protein